MPSALRSPSTGSHPRLTIGSHGAAVRKLEGILKAEGHLEGPVDGTFDAATAAAVLDYKREHHFKRPHGWVGNYLWRKFRLGEAHEGTVANVPTQPVAGRAGSFDTVTFNVKSNPVMPQAAVVHDVKEAATQGDLIGWNEIGPDRYFDAIKQLGPEWGHYMPRDGHLRIPNPISWKKSEWKLEDEGFLRTHHGKERVSPNRYITWVKLKNRETGQSVIRVNTHLVSGAWNGRVEASDPWKQQMWKLHMEKLGKLVDRLEAQGCPVVIGGDFNRNHFKVMGDEVRYDSGTHTRTHGGATLDYVMSSRDPRLHATRTHVDRDTRSDHDAVVVHYEIRP